MSLHLKYRPQTFDEVIGNEEVIEILSNMLEKGNCPHSFLFTGPTGTGKTTVARIMADELGCVGEDFKEIDIADFRGIDMAREIRRKSGYKPINGPCRVWVLDECFAKGTLITMADASVRPIEDIMEGDYVKNIQGNVQVSKTFRNKVDLNRVCLIKFRNGQTITCSEDHLFLTPDGWLKAKYLQDSFVFLNKVSKFMPNMNSLNLEKHEKNEKSMFYLWREFYIKIKLKSTDVWQSLWECFSWQQSSWDAAFLGNEGQNISQTIRIFQNRERNSSLQNAFRKNEKEQSILPTNKFGQRKSHKTIKWNSSCMERGTRGERKINNSSKIISNFFRMGNGSGNKNRAFPNGQFRVYLQLQSRPRKSINQISNRNRWKRASCEKEYITRSKENKEIESVRVASVEIYQQGSAGESFNSVIGSKERDQGYVTFYDLEIEGHPSYFANEITVHNCHELTTQAQDALLKILEDTPKHVYFILCTTDDHKLKPTLKGRCSTFAMKLLEDRQMMSLLRKVVDGEDETLLKPVYQQIIQDGLGHPRNALQILGQVLSVEPDNRLKTAEKAAVEYSQSIELCRVLLNEGSSWKKVSSILIGLKQEEPEKIRRHVLGYCQSVLLKTSNNRAALVMENFLEPFYNTLFPGLIFACYNVICGE